MQLFTKKRKPNIESNLNITPTSRNIPNPRKGLNTKIGFISKKNKEELRDEELKILATTVESINQRLQYGVTGFDARTFRLISEVLGTTKALTNNVKELSLNLNNYSREVYGRLSSLEKTTTNIQTFINQEADYLSKLSSSITQISNTVNNSLSNISKTVHQVNNMITQVFNTMSGMQKSLNNSLSRLDLLNNSVNSSHREINDLKTSTIKIESQLKSLDKSTIEEVAEKLDSMNIKLDGSLKTIEEFGRHVEKKTAKIDELVDVLRDIFKTLRQAVNDLRDKGVIKEENKIRKARSKK